MSTAVVPATQVEKPLSQWVRVQSTRDRIAAAVGDLMPADQFIEHALISFQKPEIAVCTVQSKLEAVFEMAALGLLQTLGQCFLIPYENEDGTFSAKLMPSWVGYKDVMERHPAVLEVRASLVHITDQFSFDPTTGNVLHNYDPFDTKRKINDVADIKGGYAKVTYRDGRSPHFHIVTAEKIQKARNCAQTRKVWNQWFEQMALKTVLRDTYNRRAVPIDTMAARRLEAFTHHEDAVLENDPNRGGAIDVPSEPPPRLSKAEAMAARFAPSPPVEPEVVDPPSEPQIDQTPPDPMAGYNAALARCAAAMDYDKLVVEVIADPNVTMEQKAAFQKAAEEEKRKKFTPPKANGSKPETTMEGRVDYLLKKIAWARSLPDPVRCRNELAKIMNEPSAKKLDEASAAKVADALTEAESALQAEEADAAMNEMPTGE